MFKHIIAAILLSTVTLPVFSQDQKEATATETESPEMRVKGFIPDWQTSRIFSDASKEAALASHVTTGTTKPPTQLQPLKVEIEPAKNTQPPEPEIDQPSAKTANNTAKALAGKSSKDKESTRKPVAEKSKEPLRRKSADVKITDAEPAPVLKGGNETIDVVVARKKAGENESLEEHADEATEEAEVVVPGPDGLSAKVTRKTAEDIERQLSRVERHEEQENDEPVVVRSTRRVRRTVVLPDGREVTVRRRPLPPPGGPEGYPGPGYGPGGPDGPPPGMYMQPGPGGPGFPY